MAKRSVIASPLVSLGFDASDYKAGMEAAGTWVQRFAGVASASFKSISIPGNLLTQNLVNPITSSMDAVGKVGSAAQAPFAKLMDQEKAVSEIRLLSGSIEQAQSTFKELRTTSREAGHEIGTLAGYFKTLVQSGKGVDESAQALGRYAAVSGALGEGGLGRLVEASAGFAKNTMAGVDALDQLAGQGLPIYQALADQLSKVEGRKITLQEVSMRAANGEITGAQAGGALEQAIKAPDVIAAARAADNTLSGIFGKILQTWNDYLAQFGQTLAKTFNVGAIAEFARGFMDGGRALFETFAGKAGEAVGNLEGSFDNGRALFDTVLETAGSVFVKFLEGVEEAAKEFTNLVGEIRDVMKWANPSKWNITGGAASMAMRLAPHGAAIANRNKPFLDDSDYEFLYKQIGMGQEKLSVRVGNSLNNLFGQMKGTGFLGPEDFQALHAEAFPNDGGAKAKADREIAQGRAMAAQNQFLESMDPVAMGAKDFTEKMKRANEIGAELVKTGLDGNALVARAKVKFQEDIAKRSTDLAEGIYSSGPALMGFSKTLEQIGEHAKILVATGQGNLAKGFEEDARARALLVMAKSYNPGQGIQLLNSGGQLGSQAEVEARLVERYGKQNLSMADLAKEAMKAARDDAKSIKDSIDEMKKVIGANQELVAVFN